MKKNAVNSGKTTKEGRGHGPVGQGSRHVGHRVATGGDGGPGDSVFAPGTPTRTWANVARSGPT